MKKLMTILGLVFLFACNSSKTIEGTEKCLVECSWYAPTIMGLFEFSSDGTFKSIGMFFSYLRTDWGNWQIVGPGKIKLSYTRTDDGYGGLKGETVVILSEDCNTLTINPLETYATTYTRN